MFQGKGACAVLSLVGFALMGCGTGVPGLDPNVVVIEHTDYHPPKPAEDELADDILSDKQTTFDPELADRRPLEGWLVNQSEAVIKLDVPLVLPDSEGDLLVLHPSYQAALAATKQNRSWMKTLPSVNLLDGKAKQFDDGLYAALDQAYFTGVADKLDSHQALVKRLLDKVGPESPAAPFLAAGLTLGGQETAATDVAARDEWIRKFRTNPSLAKPISFYTWNPTLEKCWAFMRYFQQSLPEGDPIVAALVAALASDSALQADYDQAAGFYAKLTNPLSRLSLGDLVGADVSTPEKIDALRTSKGVSAAGVAFFPPSTSREFELYSKLFPLGLPENANLMQELVRAIRSGKIDLTPRENSGWYDHQVFALETMLLPEVGEEHHKLLLTKPYKKRMLEAFAALITKRRETHARQLDAPKATAAAPPQELENVSPRLRVEPCPSYFVRTARSYAFLHNFLTASLGEETLRALRGLRQEGERETDLATELAAQRDLFYGLYLVSCEDIGHKPALKEGEADAEACYAAATAWLEKLDAEQDLAADTRVAVPIYVDPQKGTLRLWVTLGVRMTKLSAHFVRAPRLKPAEGEGEWKQVEDWKLQPVDYLIAVDEFAEVEVPTLSPPNREELRKLCDQHQTKEKIVEALRTGAW
jgi:hypothetical protein